MIKKNHYIKNNIYPRSLENITALLNFYFKEHTISEVQEYATLLYNENKMSLDQIEKYSYLISESQIFFMQHIKEQYRTINLYFKYTQQLLELPENQWTGSKTGTLLILKAYRQYLINSGLI
jgi:hypothetical protein